MTKEQIKNLHQGDQVYWEDPDGGIGSRVYQILTIEMRGEVVRITEPDGSVLECFPDELS